MLLKVYTRVFTNDIRVSLPLYKQIVNSEPDFDVTYGKLKVVAIGNFLIIAGPEEALAPVRSSQGTIVVDNLKETGQFLEQVGAVILQEVTQGPTGESIHARHPDGNTFEYVQWKAEFVKQVMK